MTAKQYLQQAFRLNARIDVKVMELEQLRQIPIQKVSPGFTQGQKKKKAASDPVVKIIEKIEAAEQDINEKIKKLVDLKCEIGQRIESMTEDELRLILQKRYVNFQKWEEIADDLNITYQWAHTLHRKALKIFSAVYKSLL
jgi:anaerobic ribonucleoside-triphosphate reductase